MLDLKIAIFIFCIIAPTVCQDGESLRFVQILFRHGDRTPTKTFPSDTLGEAGWPNGFGQLTQVGMEQLYHLGQFFRRRYGSFINSTYVKNEVSVLSTDKDRTLMSASCMLAGLYPPVGFQKWGKANISLGQIWQPIPVPSVSYYTNPFLSTDPVCPLYDQLYHELLISSKGTDLVEEYQLLSTDVPCPSYDDMFDEVVNSDEGKNFKKHFKPLIDHVMKEAGWPDDASQTLPHMWDTYDTIYCMKQHYKTEPEWVEGDRDLLYELDMFKVRSQDFLYHTDHMIKIKAGTFLTRLLNNTNSWMNKQLNPQKKIFFYSSHDSLVGAVLYALEAWNFRLPPYGCALLFEVHEMDGKYRMKVLYKNDTMTNAVEGEPVVLQLPGCGETCELQTFINLLQPYLLEDYDKECSKTKTHYSVIGVVLGVIGGVLLIMVIGVAIWCHKKKKHTYNYRSANFSVDDQDI